MQLVFIVHPRTRAMDSIHCGENTEPRLRRWNGFCFWRFASVPGPVRKVGNGEGFRAPAPSLMVVRDVGPASESLPRRKPRAGRGAVWSSASYGDLRIADGSRVSPRRRLTSTESEADPAKNSKRRIQSVVSGPAQVERPAALSAMAIAVFHAVRAGFRSGRLVRELGRRQ